MKFILTKKQLDSIKFGVSTVQYIMDTFGFLPSLNSINVCELNKKGPGKVREDLVGVTPVVIRYSSGEIHIEKMFEESNMTWKHCSVSGDIFYGDGQVSPNVDQQSTLDQWDDYTNDNMTSRPQKIQRKKHTLR